MPIVKSDVERLLYEIDKLRKGLSPWGDCTIYMVPGTPLRVERPTHVGVGYLDLLHRVGDVADLVRRQLERQKSGMPAGYRFDVEVCSDCGQRVAGNWIVRHRKSGCTIGGKSDDG